MSGLAGKQAVDTITVFKRRVNNISPAVGTYINPILLPLENRRSTAIGYSGFKGHFAAWAKQLCLD
jgi:hypothetical protein